MIIAIIICVIIKLGDENESEKQKVGTNEIEKDQETSDGSYEEYSGTGSSEETTDESNKDKPTKSEDVIPTIRFQDNIRARQTKNRSSHNLRLNPNKLEISSSTNLSEVSTQDLDNSNILDTTDANLITN